MNAAIDDDIDFGIKESSCRVLVEQGPQAAIINLSAMLAEVLSVQDYSDDDLPPLMNRIARVMEYIEAGYEGTKDNPDAVAGFRKVGGIMRKMRQP